MGSFFGFGSPSPGVNYEFGVKSGNFPGGKAVGFVADSDLSVQPVARGGRPNNGISQGESLDLIYNYLDSSTLADVMDAFDEKRLRMGFHVQSIAPTEDSETYISSHVNPVPGSMLLGCIGMGVATFGLRRRIRRDASQ